MARQATKRAEGVDTELDDLPPSARHREWMNRVEAVIFAANKPVTRDVLARVVGRSCNIDDLIDDLRDALHDRPYELALVAGGWQLRTRRGYGDAIRAALGQSEAYVSLSKAEELVLTAVAYMQPITRGELSQLFGREISRDTIGALRGAGMVSTGPRSPRAGAPYTYVTTEKFLVHFGFGSLRDLPDIERLEDAGLLGTDSLKTTVGFEVQEDEA